MSKEQLPGPNWFVIRLVRLVAWILAKIYFRYHVEGGEKFPAEGPYIAVSNHVTTMDAIFLGLPLKGHVAYLVKKEALEHPLKGPFFKAIGGIPVDRGTLDINTAKTALKCLRHGMALGILPEGTRTRNGQIGEFKPGFVKLAILAHAPIVPAAIIGSFGILPTPYWFPRPAKVTLRVGDVIDLHEYYGKKTTEEEIQRISKTIREEIIRLYNG
ncbi:MAG: lysophospholipid acyltransferase family protein [Anaerolineae bacterium]